MFQKLTREGVACFLPQLRTDCQTLSGTAYRVTVPARRENFRILSGTPKVYVKTGESGRRRAQAFCADCGTPIYSAESDDPQAYAIRLGTAREPALRADRAR